MPLSHPGQAHPDAAPTFSVIVPAYNAAATLGRCLAALRACRPAAGEIIVVDDASRDGTAEVARTFPARFVQAEKNLGPGGARNRGAAMAAGSILVFIDADVLVEPDLFARLTAFFNDHPQAAAVSGVYAADCPARSFASRYKNYYLIDSFAWMTGRVGALNTSLAAVRRDVFEAQGGFDARLRRCEDTILGAELALAGHDLFFEPSLVARHLKEYTVAGLLREDLAKSIGMAAYLLRQGRALPRLLARRIGHHHQPARLALAPAAWALAAATLALVLGPSAAAVLIWLALAGGYALLGAPLWRLIRRGEGLGFTVAAGALHWVQMLAAGGAILWAGIFLLTRSGRGEQP